MTTDPNDPTRHWDGQQWLKWNGAAWLPEGQVPRTPEPAAPVPEPSAATEVLPVGPDPADPTRSFDGRQWLKWDGVAWLPEGAVAAGAETASTAKSGNWFGRHKVLTTLGAVVIVIVIIAIASGSSQPATPAAASAPPTTAASSSAATSAQPTEAASVTPTPTPTPTASLPAAAVTFRGHGDKIISLPSALGTVAKIVALTTNGQANFIVEPLDSTGSPTGSLVNTIGHYSGTVGLNLDGSSQIAALKVQADGSWVITVADPTTARRWSGSGPLTGHGDDVVIVIDAVSSGLNTVNITHKGQANFIVDAWGTSSGSNTLVNEIGNYSGQQVLPSDSVLVVIQADGLWTISKA